MTPDSSRPGSSVHGILQTRIKNTGVGWHFILQGILLTQGSNLRLLCLLHWQAGSLLLATPACCACVLNHLSCPTLCNPMDTDLQVPFCPWDSPGKNTGVDCHALLQGFFQTWGSNLRLLRLLRCRQVLYPLSHLESIWGWFKWKELPFRDAFSGWNVWDLSGTWKTTNMVLTLSSGTQVSTAEQIQKL